MGKKFTHGDAVSHHVFYCLVAWVFAGYLLTKGLGEVDDGVSDPVFAWGFVISGCFALVGMPIRLWLAWPTKPPLLDCPACGGNPPAGFSCKKCGAS